MADIKGMVQQIIKYADGSETVINYHVDGTVRNDADVLKEASKTEVVEEAVETPVEVSEEVSEESEEVSE